MSNKLLLLSLTLLLQGGLLATSAYANDVIDRVQATNKGWQDMSASLEMSLDDGKGREAKRAMRLQAKETDAGAGHTLLVFEGPADVKGTALLSRAGEGNQFLYLPATKRARRIAGGNRAGSFVGSEFAYEDITGIEKDAHTWKSLGQKPCGDATCELVEATPNYKGSGYGRRVLYIDAARSVPLKVVFFDKKGEKLKTLRYANYKKYDGQFWRAGMWSMKNHQNGRSTALRFNDYVFKKGLKDSQFTKGALKRAL